MAGILEKVYTGSTFDWRHAIKAQGRTVAIVSRKSSGTNAVHYALEDHQGSSSTLTSSSGGLLARQSFTAFGLPRDGSDWDGVVPSGDEAIIHGVSRRGYTGHSMLGTMGLVHMNGRVQDAISGRFLSPDPTVPNPGFTQMFNRYAYVNNNPLSYTDPNGFDPCALGYSTTSMGGCTQDLDEVTVTASRLREHTPAGGCMVRPEGCAVVLPYAFPHHFDPCKTGWDPECDLRQEEVSVMDQETRQERLQRLEWPRQTAQGSQRPPAPPPQGQRSLFSRAAESIRDVVDNVCRAPAGTFGVQVQLNAGFLSLFGVEGQASLSITSHGQIVWNQSIGGVVGVNNGLVASGTLQGGVATRDAKTGFSTYSTVGGEFIMAAGGGYSAGLAVATDGSGASTGGLGRGGLAVGGGYVSGMNYQRGLALASGTACSLFD